MQQLPLTLQELQPATIQAVSSQQWFPAARPVIISFQDVSIRFLPVVYPADLIRHGTVISLQVNRL